MNQKSREYRNIFYAFIAIIFGIGVGLTISDPRLYRLLQSFKEDGGLQYKSDSYLPLSSDLEETPDNLKAIMVRYPRSWKYRLMGESLAEFYLTKGEKKEAENIYEKLKMRYPAMPLSGWISLARGKAYIHAGGFKVAREELLNLKKMLVDPSPLAPLVLLALGEAEFKGGNYKNAELCWKELLLNHSMSPETKNARKFLYNLKKGR